SSQSDAAPIQSNVLCQQQQQQQALNPFSSINFAAERVRPPMLPRQNSFDEATTAVASSAAAAVSTTASTSGTSASAAAISHQQVRQKLQEVILSKKKIREQSNSPPEWASPQSSFESAGSPPSQWQAQHTFPLPSGSPLSKDDFPLRKTNSEPNLKVRAAALRLQQHLHHHHHNRSQQHPHPHHHPAPQHHHHHHHHRGGSGVLDRSAKRRIRYFLERGGSSGGSSSGGGSLDQQQQQQQMMLQQQQQQQLQQQQSFHHASLPNLSGAHYFAVAAAAAAAASAAAASASGSSNTAASVTASASKSSRQSGGICCSMTGAPGLVAAAASGLCRPAESLPRRRAAHDKQLSRTRSAPLPMLLPPPPPSATATNPQQQQQLKAKSAAVKAQLRNKVLHRAGSADDATNSNTTAAGSVASCSSSNIGSSIQSTVAESFSGAFPPLLAAVAGAGAAASSVSDSSSLIREEKIIEDEPVDAEDQDVHSRDSGDATGASASPNGTALAYDEGMLAHRCMCNQSGLHPENPFRLELVWQRLVECGLAARCLRFRSRKATIEELRLCHDEMYSVLHATQPSQRTRLDPTLLLNFKFAQLPCGGFGVDTDTVWIEGGTAQACRLAVGVLLELCQRIALGDCRNGLALIRPPGHHAEHSQAMGFCYFNSVAIAARSLVRSGQAARVCIVDWDVHHGNGTQSTFYSDPSVLYISLHRYDGGAFFPGSGALDEIGTGAGLGTNINIPWSGQVMGDAEYLAAFRAIVLPVVAQYAPNILLVSAGFDAARGHPSNLGGYCLSPEGFAQLTWQLLHATPGGRVALALEGGYDLATLPACVEACLRVLLGEPVPQLSDAERLRRPNADAVELIHQVVRVQRPFWGACLGLAPAASTVDMSVEEATQRLHALSFGSAGSH
ncbi:hypothetical protein BOX15_Mlig002081g3, partial [Macrostomum lignano]